MAHKILFIIVTLLFSFHLTTAVDENCNRNTPNVSLTYRTKKYWRKKAYCKILLNDMNAGSDLQTQCQNSTEEYFKNNAEETETVEQYATKCKQTMQESWSQCTNIILHFNSLKLCWNMNTAQSLFNIFAKENFQTDLQNINLKYSDYLYFENAKINLSSCSLDFKDSYKNTMDGLNYYKELRDDLINDKTYANVDCDCPQISAIYKFYSLKKGCASQEKENGGNGEKNLTGEQKNELFDLFREICFVKLDPAPTVLWSAKKIKVLIDNEKLISLKIFKGLMTVGTKLVAAGLYDHGWPSRYWPIGFLLSKIIRRGEDVIDEYLVNTVTLAILTRLSAKNYQKYIDLLSKVDGFNTLECQNNILEIVLYKATTKKDQPNTYIWLYEPDRSGFFEHMELLLNIYHKPPRQGTSCDNFSKYFTFIEKILYSNFWVAANINDFIRAAINAGMEINEFVQCLVFSHNISIYTTNLMLFPRATGTKVKWVPNDKEQELFRLKLFANVVEAKTMCTSESIKIDMKNYKGLKRIYKKVLNW